MAVLNIPIKLDVAEENIMSDIMAMQGDLDSRYLIVTVANNGIPMQIDKNSSVSINIKRPDEEQQTFTGEVNEDGTVKVMIPSWALVLEGVCNCNISFIETDGTILSTMPFNIVVNPSNATEIIVYVVYGNPLPAGTYYITIDDEDYSFTTTEEIPIGGTIRFSRDFTLASTYKCKVIEKDLPITNEAEGTKLSEGTNGGIIKQIIKFMSHIAQRTTQNEEDIEDINATIDDIEQNIEDIEQNKRDRITDNHSEEAVYTQKSDGSESYIEASEDPIVNSITLRDSDNNISSNDLLEETSIFKPTGIVSNDKIYFAYGYAIYDNYYNGNNLRYLICLDPPKGKIYFISIANDIISTDSQIFDIDFQAHRICNVGTEIVLFNYDGDLAKLTPVFDIDIDNNQVNLTGVSLDIVGHYEALKKYSPYFSIDKIDNFGNRTKFFIGYYKSYNSNFTCNWIEIFHDTFHVDEWHVNVGEELSLPRSKAIHVRGYRDGLYYGIGYDDYDSDTIDNVYKFNNDNKEFIKIDSIKYSEIPFKCDIVDRVTGYNEYYSIIVRKEGASQCNIFVYTPSKYGSRYFIDSGIIKYDVRGTVIEYYTGTPRDFFDNKYIVSGNKEKYILTGKLGKIYSPLVSKKYVDDLKSYTDKEISDLKDYTDTENNNLKDYTDNEISDLKNYSDTELSKKVDKYTESHPNYGVAYIQKRDGTENVLPLIISTEPNSIILRGVNGQSNITVSDNPLPTEIVNVRYVTENFVHQQSNTDTFAKIYGRNTSDNEQLYPLRTVESPNTVVYRDGNSTFEVGEPVADKNPTTKKYVDDIGDTKVDKITTTNSYNRVYAVSSSGNQINIPVTTDETAITTNSIVRRDSNGFAHFKNPTNDSHPATKKYVDTKSDTGLQDAKDYADQKKSEANTYTDTKVSELVNSSPETLDTLKELADALGNDPNFATTVANEIGTKVTSIAQKGTHTNKKVYVNGSDGVDTTIDAVSSNTASTIVIRDVNGNTKVSDPVDALDASNKSYTDTVGSNTLQSAKDYTDTIASNTLNSAKSYTDTKDSEMSTRVDSVVSDMNSKFDTANANIDKKLDKITTSTGYNRAYIVDGDGSQSTKDLDVSPNPLSIVYRNVSGYFYVNPPTNNSHPSNKKYVDDNDYTTLTSAKSYADTELSNLSTKTTTDIATSLSTAKSYTDSEISKISTSTTTGLDKKVDKFTGDKAELADIVYGQKYDGDETVFYHSSADLPETIVSRDAAGRYEAADPTTNYHVTNKKYVDDADQLKLDKVNTSGTYTRVYGIGADGSQFVIPVTVGPYNETLILRDNGGNFNINTPTADSHPTTKKYVDDAFGNVKNSSHISNGLSYCEQVIPLLTMIGSIGSYSQYIDGIIDIRSEYNIKPCSFRIHAERQVNNNGITNFYVDFISNSNKNIVKFGTFKYNNKKYFGIIVNKPSNIASSEYSAFKLFDFVGYAPNYDVFDFINYNNLNTGELIEEIQNSIVEVTPSEGYSLSLKANKTELDGKVDKLSGSYKLYSVNDTNSQGSVDYSMNPSAYCIPQRTGTGSIRSVTPNDNADVTTKLYVDTADNKKVNKVAQSNIVYATDENGTDTTLPYDINPSIGSVVLRDSNKSIVTNEPVQLYHAATKKYVDDSISAKEDAFTKNTAFNKNFGTTAGTVTEGNDSRLSDARPASDVSAWAKASTKPTYTKAEVGLGNVDNVKQYSASNPPPYPVTSVAGKTGAVSLTKSDVGLGNVTNDAQVKRTEMGSAGGVATLDTEGKVPASQLPSYVDDVIEYGGYNKFPLTGESGKIYVDVLTNKTYRWSGTGYTEIAQSIALGETSSTAYPGNKGKQNADNISSLQSSVSTITSNISSLQTSVSQNKSRISALESNKADSTDVQLALVKKLDKDESMGSTERVYAVDTTGANHMISASSNATANHLVQRDLNGDFYVNAPTNENNPTTKKYVDEKVSAIDLSDYAKKDGSNARGTWNDVTAGSIKGYDNSGYTDSVVRRIYMGSNDSNYNGVSYVTSNNEFTYRNDTKTLNVGRVDGVINVKDFSNVIIRPVNLHTNSITAFRHDINFDKNSVSDYGTFIHVGSTRTDFNSWFLGNHSGSTMYGNLMYRNALQNTLEDWRTLVDSKNYAEVIPAATETKDGLMSGADKTKLNKLDPYLINIYANSHSSPSQFNDDIVIFSEEEYDYGMGAMMTVSSGINGWIWQIGTSDSNLYFRSAPSDNSEFNPTNTILTDLNYGRIIGNASKYGPGLMSKEDKSKLDSIPELTAITTAQIDSLFS